MIVKLDSKEVIKKLKLSIELVDEDDISNFKTILRAAESQFRAKYREHDFDKAHRMIQDFHAAMEQNV